MDRLLYTALSGLRRGEVAQAVTAHNLANASTTGYRRDVGSFDSRWLVGPDLDTRVQSGAQLKGVDLSQGPIVTTGRSLDVALQGDAMLAVEAPGGGEAYSRRGDLQLDASGNLRTGDGLAVLSDGGPLTLPPADAIEIAPDGAISLRPPGADPAAPLIPAGRLKLVAAGPGKVSKSVDGLFRAPDGSILAADPAMRLRPGAIEGANVSPVTALTELIEQSRAFEMQTRLVREARQLDEAGAQLMRLE